jgi:hypothetical protein
LALKFPVGRSLRQLWKAAWYWLGIVVRGLAGVDEAVLEDDPGGRPPVPKAWLAMLAGTPLLSRQDVNCARDAANAPAAPERVVVVFEAEVALEDPPPHAEATATMAKRPRARMGTPAGRARHPRLLEMEAEITSLVEPLLLRQESSQIKNFLRDAPRISPFIGFTEYSQVLLVSRTNRLSTDRRATCEY